MHVLSTLPAFVGYFAMSLGYLAVFLAAYCWLTPHAEWALIRAGNAAAATGLVGAAVGFCLPLASVVAHSAGVMDMAVWASVALVAQVLAFVLLRTMLGGISAAIGRGEMAAGVMLGGGSLAVGILNAACLTY